MKNSIAKKASKTNSAKSKAVAKNASNPAFWAKVAELHRSIAHSQVQVRLGRAVIELLNSLAQQAVPGSFEQDEAHWMAGEHESEITRLLELSESQATELAELLAGFEAVDLSKLPKPEGEFDECLPKHYEEFAKQAASIG